MLGITILSFKPYSLQTTAKPIPVFPAVPSTIIPPFEISFRLIASWTINNAALSLTDSPGLKYSAFPYIWQPVNSEACFSLTNGVFPIWDITE